MEVRERYGFDPGREVSIVPPAACPRPLRRATIVASRSAAMNKLILIPHQQSTGLYVLHRDNPDNPMRWIMPEAVSGLWGFDLVRPWYFVPGARWEARPDGGVTQEHRVPGVGRYRTELRVTDEYVEARLTVWNERSFAAEEVTSCPCWEFRNAPVFYGADAGTDALSRAWIASAGRLVPLADTDRRPSQDGVLPVYAVRGVAGPATWQQRVADGYGWGLCPAIADDGFIGIESTDGSWSTATEWRGAYSVSFNTKPPWHGCIHSHPFLGSIPAGGSVEVRGRAWLTRGPLRELYARRGRP
jgi:hypothetical protein